LALEDAPAAPQGAIEDVPGETKNAMVEDVEKTLEEMITIRASMKMTYGLQTTGQFL